MKGKPYRIRVTDGSSKVLIETTATYQPSASPPYFTPPIQMDNLVCDSSGCGRHIRIGDSYDKFGNVTQEDQFGDIAEPTDDRTIVREFSPNESTWVVGLPSSEIIYQGIGDTRRKVGATDFFYDGENTCIAPSMNRKPVRGDLTRVVPWNDGGPTLDTRMG